MAERLARFGQVRLRESVIPMKFRKRDAKPGQPILPTPDRFDPGTDPDTGRDKDTRFSLIDDMQLEVALYIESLSAELRIMARKNDLESLAYFLEMARIEASIQVERRALQLER